MGQSDILRSSIQRMQNEIRGGVDGWDFTQLVLTTLFSCYVSERPPSQQGRQLRFDDVLEYLGDERLGETLNNYFRSIDEIYDVSLGVDCTSDRLGDDAEERTRNLSIILRGVADLELGDGIGIDIFGDAYEFLISNYAAHAGKSGGEFFTPQCASRLIARIARRGLTDIDNVYDPTCGSGSLLIRARESRAECDVYGQEINLTTYNLARMNMILHGVPTDKIHIVRGDTLAHDGHAGKQFDVIVSNPPYSTRWAGSDNPEFIKDERFAPAGVLAPKAKADLAFVMHALHHLSPRGRAAIVCFPGILYRSGVEQKIRKYLVDNNFVEAVISLPSNLFYSTTIPVNVLVLSKHKQDKYIRFIDASNLCKKVGKFNELDIEHECEICHQLDAGENVPGLARSAHMSEAIANECDLSVGHYVEAKDMREKVDIDELEAEIARAQKARRDAEDKLDAFVQALRAQG